MNISRMIFRDVLVNIIVAYKKCLCNTAKRTFFVKKQTLMGAMDIYSMNKAIFESGEDARGGRARGDAQGWLS